MLREWINITVSSFTSKRQLSHTNTKNRQNLDRDCASQCMCDCVKQEKSRLCVQCKQEQGDQ